MSLTAFAKQIGVKPKTLSWWRKKLGPDATTTRRPRRREATTMPPLNFIEMSAAVERGPIEIALGSGIAVRVHSGFDTATLARVLDVLQARQR